MHASLHKFILPCIARVLRCLFPPLSLPCSAGNRRRSAAPQTVQIVIMWTAPLSIALGVTAKKNISR